jgi:arylsulfatase A-like enzyme
VLLLTVDTLRPDYMSANGYDLPTTPFLDSLLAEGMYFEQAVSPIPRTTPALASLLTGAYPHTTGLRVLTGKLSGEVTTLAEAFATSGYQTLAVVSNQVLARRRGLARGFHRYEVGGDERTARSTAASALRALDLLEPGEPFFAWIHFMDPHVPYHPDPEVAARFSPDYRGPYQLHFGRIPGPGEPASVYRTFPPDLPKEVATHRNPLSEQVNQHIRRLYAGDIRTLDHELEHLVAAFRARDDDLIIVFTADHGESLGEHHLYFDHGDYVYNASTRVPLAVVLPDSHPAHGPGRCRGWVSLVDVVPTLFALMRRQPPATVASQIEGRSLEPCFRGKPLPPKPVFAESGHAYYPQYVPNRKLNKIAGRFRAVVLGDWKLIWTPFQTRELTWELYNLREDPHETENLYRPDHPDFAQLKTHLDAWLAPSDYTRPASEFSEEDRKILRELGYIK